MAAKKRKYFDINEMEGIKYKDSYVSPKENVCDKKSRSLKIC